MLSIVLDDALADAVGGAAAATGQAVNNYAVLVLQKHLEDNKAYQALYETLQSFPNIMVVRRNGTTSALVVYLSAGDEETENKVYRLEQSLYLKYPDALFEVTIEEVAEPLLLDKRELSPLPAGVG